METEDDFDNDEGSRKSRTEERFAKTRASRDTQLKGNAFLNVIFM